MGWRAETLQLQVGGPGLWEREREEKDERRVSL